jgi:2-methylcitrate dehydratase
MAMREEPEYPGALSTPTWGYEDALNKGAPIRLGRPLGSYVVERVLFKVPWPAEFHAQTAVEAAVRLHPEVRDRLDEVTRVRIDTQESALRIIDKRGPLRNPADRDHCLQYAVAVALIRGTLTAEDYEDEAGADPRIDRLREMMEVVEQPAYSRDYLDPEKRSVGNAVQVWFQDGTATQPVAVEYPLGHPRRRAEAIPYLWKKLEDSLAGRWPEPRSGDIVDRLRSPDVLDVMSVSDFMELLTESPSP